MGWHYLPPGMFPYTFHDAHKHPPATLRVSSSRADLLGLAEQWRRFRWCLRQSSDHEAIERERTITYRATIHKRRDGFALIITAKPKLLNSILTLNPELQT